MKKLAIIGANEFQNPLILKAKALGYETHVFAWEAGDIGERTADVFHPISITEKQTIADLCQELGVEACCSIGSDLAIHTVNHVQRRLHKPCNPVETDTIATNKYAMRQAFQKAGVPCPRFVSVGDVPAPEVLAGMTYPVIVKPTDRSGSRGIFKAETYDQVCQAVPQALDCSFEKKAIIEEFLDGEEFSCESISFAGEHHILALTKKYTTGAPHFIETGHHEPAHIPPAAQAQIRTHIPAALDALHIQYGASHAEFKITPQGEVRIIEIGSRMGGDCIGSDLVYLSTGMDFMKMVIDTACGKAPDLTCVRTPAPASIRFIFSQADRDELETVRRTAENTLWRWECDQEHLTDSVTDSSNRHGYWITTEAQS
jgi:biotin carboxylase